MEISIVMSVYNETISEINKSINSILRQTYSNFEFIIVLDNPNNEVLKSELKRVSEKDKRIKLVINTENKGLAYSLNQGIKVSKGKYIVRMDADDISKTNRLEKQLNFLLKNPDIDVLGTAAYVINENDVEIGEINVISEENKLKKRMQYINSFIHPTLIMKREILEKIGLYREFPCAQDYDLTLRIITSGGKVANLSEKLLYYRIRKNNLTSQKGLFQFLLSEYAKKLNLQRKKLGKDNFSVKDIYIINQEAQTNTKIFSMYQQKLKESRNNLEYYFKLIEILFKSKYHRKMFIDKLKYLLSK